MQTTENEEKKLSLAPADTQSQPLQPVSTAQGDEIADDPTHLTPAEADAILKLAETEIQPLLRKMRRERWTGWLQGFLCVSLILFSMGGILWQCITYPHTLVVLYAKVKPASITATLDLSTRTLAPVTITRSETTVTTGTGHQDARAATGTLTFYNGQLQAITVANGTVYTSRDREQIVITQDVVIPAADPSTTPPTYGQATVYAQAIHKGATGNIAAFDINGSCCATSVIVKNLTSFHNGQDARNYRAVAPQDLQSLTTTINDKLTQAFTNAFSLQPSEAAIPTNCHTTTTPNHHIGEAAQSVTLTASKTCAAIAYNRQQLEQQATAAFTKTRPGTTYHLIGSVLTTIQSVSPYTITINGKWVYTFSPDYEQLLAEKIAGDTPAQARKVLLQSGIISYASIPSTLPSAMYINFLILV